MSYPPLTAWRIWYDDGDSDVHNAAAGITLAEAQRYWIGGRHYLDLAETRFRTIVKVEPFTGAKHDPTNN